MLSRIVAAATLAAAAYAGLPVAPASAAACSSTDGVTVVVDFHELGGGVQSACVPDGGGDTAASLFTAAGFGLTYVQRSPSFVCRVSGKPADDPCVNTPPADAYWALFWSDGESGSWTYATSGAGSQKVPDGGYVAFSWNGSSARSAPGMSPAPHAAPQPTPTQGPTHTPGQPPSHGATHAPSGSASSPSADATEPSASPTSGGAAATDKPGKKHHRSSSPSADASPASADPTPSDDAAASAETAPVSSEAADPADGGLPAWVAPSLIVVLFGAAGGAALMRRRRAGRP